MWTTPYKCWLPYALPPASVNSPVSVDYPWKCWLLPQVSPNPASVSLNYPQQVSNTPLSVNFPMQGLTNAPPSVDYPLQISTTPADINNPHKCQLPLSVDFPRMYGLPSASVDYPPQVSTTPASAPYPAQVSTILLKCWLYLARIDYPWQVLTTPCKQAWAIVLGIGIGFTIFLCIGFSWYT